MICYTRNFEDVILQRVLADVQQGWYLDVGAGEPIVDSNTYAFYQKGWRGVAIEPLPVKKMWQDSRPKDILINAAIGEKPGSLSMQIYAADPQSTTASQETISYWKNRGREPVQSLVVPVMTLNDVISKNLPNRPLHILSIDVEGMELQVLHGIDLALYRPWIIVMEAVIPNSQTPSHAAWEPLLITANYSMVCFDGVNRFYLANEFSQLRERFILPPNVWDNFQMAKQLELIEQIKNLTAEVARLKQALAHAASFY